MTKTQVEALFLERSELKMQIKKLTERLSEIEETVGLDDIDGLWHYEGTSMSGWSCKKVTGDFLGF